MKEGLHKLLEETPITLPWEVVQKKLLDVEFEMSVKDGWLMAALAEWKLAFNTDGNTKIKYRFREGDIITWIFAEDSNILIHSLGPKQCNTFELFQYLAGIEEEQNYRRR